MKLKLPVVALSLLIVLVMTAIPAQAWQESPSYNDWWYINAQVPGDWYVTGPLVIELNGDSSAGQTLFVGDTVDITVDLHAYAISCGGTGNGAYTAWLLEVSGPSGPGSDIGLEL